MDIEDETSLRNLVIDQRGNINRLAIDITIRSLWQKPREPFKMVTLSTFMECIRGLLYGEECFLFRKDISISSHQFKQSSQYSTVSLELDGPLMLNITAMPFIRFVNKLQNVEESLRVNDSDNKLAQHPQIFHLVSFHLKELFAHFRHQLAMEIATDTDSSSEWEWYRAKRCLDGILKRCNSFSRFLDVIVGIVKQKHFQCSAMIDDFFVARTLIGNVNEDVKIWCDQLLVIVIQYCYEKLLRWIRDGVENIGDGLFERNTTSSKTCRMDEDPKWALTNIVQIWRCNFGIELRSNLLMDENWCAKWMSKGKMRKLINWCNFINNNSSNINNYDTNNNNNYNNLVILQQNCKIWNTTCKEDGLDITDEDIMKTIRSSAPTQALQALFDSKYNKLLQKQSQDKILNNNINNNININNNSIMDNFRETYQFVEETFLCKETCIIESIMSVMKPEKRCNRLIRGDIIQKIHQSFVERNYNKFIVQRLRIDVASENNISLTLHYEPIFPLQIVFTKSIMDSFSDIWMLLASLSIELNLLQEVELNGQFNSWRYMLMRSRMMDFLAALLMYLHSQCDCILSQSQSLRDSLLSSKTLDEAHSALKHLLALLRRRCFLGQRHIMLANVLRNCILAINCFRLANLKENFDEIEAAFKDFDENTELFCNAIKIQSENNDLLLSNLLILVDFLGYYTNFQQSPLKQ